MSQLTDFYRGTAPDTEGRRIQDIWAWSDDDLEVVHDNIQWLFPLPELSHYNPDAPILSREDISTFRSEEVIQTNLRKSFDRILIFLGLTKTDSGEVTEGANFAMRIPDVWAAPNHNWLRITRILRSLKLLGLEVEAEAFFRWLDTAYSSRRFPITAETYRFWAVTGSTARRPG